MSTALTTLTSTLAKRFEIGDGAGLMETLKATAFKGQVSDAQMTALLIVANQYGLNPWTKEVYAFPDKNNGIVPVVGVDGWARIINSNPQFDGMEFEQDDEKCTCKIYRKDRSRATAVTEYMKECKRPNVGPWVSHPMRMLRHKAMIQCARLAFGFGGIYDQDEAERIVERNMGDAEVVSHSPARTERTELDEYPADRFTANLPVWRKHIESGNKTAEQLIAMVSSKATLTEDQKAAIRAPFQPAHIDDDGVIDADFVREMEGQA
jgi:phage recombination protein Bet